MTQKSVRSVKQTMTFTDLALRRLDVKKKLQEINKARRARAREAGLPRPPEVNQAEIWDKAQPGLSLMILSGGTKTFRSQYKLHGRWLTRAIGRFGEVVLDGENEENANVSWARERVRQDRTLARQGIDPREAEPKPSATTFESVAEEYIEKHAKVKQRTWEQTERVLLKNCQPWLKRPINQISAQDAYKLLDGFVADGHGPKAELVHAHLRTFWRWASRRRYVASPPMMDDVDKPSYEARTRARIFTDDDIKAIWKAADAIDLVQGCYIKLLLLLAPRKSELSGMQWSELDDRKRPTIWTTPHERTKSKKTATKKRVYLTPLPPLAQRIFKQISDGDGELVFPGRVKGVPLDPGTPLVNKLMDLGAPPYFSYHMCRHTISTWLQNEGHDDFDIGLVLNHAGGGSVTSGYQHGYSIKRKLELLTKWAEHIERLTAPEAPEVETLEDDPYLWH